MSSTIAQLTSKSIKKGESARQSNLKFHSLSGILTDRKAAANSSLDPDPTKIGPYRKKLKPNLKNIELSLDIIDIYDSMTTNS